MKKQILGNEFWTKLDEKGDRLRYENFSELIEYAAPHLKLFLDQDVENLIVDNKPRDAYELLCSKYPNLAVNRIKTGKQTPFDELLMNAIEYHCIIVGPDIFTSKNEDDLSEYFFIKADVLQDNNQLYNLQYEECLRLYYVNHQDELRDDIIKYNIKHN